MEAKEPQIFLRNNYENKYVVKSNNKLTNVMLLTCSVKIFFILSVNNNCVQLTPECSRNNSLVSSWLV